MVVFKSQTGFLQSDRHNHLFMALSVRSQVTNTEQEIATRAVPLIT